MDDIFIKRFQQGDPAFIGELYEAYGPALFNIILRIVRSQELAEQVLQDTFVKVWRYGSSFDASKGRLFTWLLNIARNTAIDATRTTQYRHYTITDDISTMSYSLHTEPLHVDGLDVREEAGRLNAKYYRLVDLVYFQGFSQQEAAAEVGIPLGTLKTRLRQALLLMRRRFSDHLTGDLTFAAGGA